MTKAAQLPRLLELAAQIRERTPYTGPSSAELVRADRDGR